MAAGAQNIFFPDVQVHVASTGHMVAVFTFVLASTMSEISVEDGGTHAKMYAVKWVVGLFYTKS